MRQVAQAQFTMPPDLLAPSSSSPGSSKEAAMLPVAQAQFHHAA